MTNLLACNWPDKWQWSLIGLICTLEMLIKSDKPKEVVPVDVKDQSSKSLVKNSDYFIDQAHQS